MRTIPEWLAMIGLAMLVLYCTFGLLFTGGGRELGASALLFWAAVIGGSVAVLFLGMGKEVGRWAGIGVYVLGAVYYFIGAFVSKRPAGDRIFLVSIAAGNALGFYVLYRSRAKSASTKVVHSAE